MKTIENIIRNTTMKDVGAMKLEANEFIELFNNKEAILLDIRYPFEKEVWEVKFAYSIAYNELPDRLDELPKDKIIVCACPEEYRANMAKEYLRFKGFNAKTLTGGLLELMKTLKGGKAKNINLG